MGIAGLLGISGSYPHPPAAAKQGGRAPIEAAQKTRKRRGVIGLLGHLSGKPTPKTPLRGPNAHSGQDAKPTTALRPPKSSIGSGPEPPPFPVRCQWPYVVEIFLSDRLSRNVLP